MPEIKKNLLSIGRTSEKGMRVIFEEGGKRVIFYKSNKFIVDGFREDGKLYKLNFWPVCKYSEENVSTSSSLKEWHEKLGHVNFQTLRQMITNCAVNDLKVFNLDKENPFCEACVLGKQHRNPFPTNEAIRAKKAGELFHADLCGKMSQSSIGGANYFLLLKDDFSKYCFVYFVKEKSHVLEAFKNSMLMLELIIVM